MNPPNAAAQSSATPPLPHLVPLAGGSNEDDDLALGWECANPALQIDSWGAEAPSQPLQSFY